MPQLEETKQLEPSDKITTQLPDLQSVSSAKVQQKRKGQTDVSHQEGLLSNELFLETWMQTLFK